MASAAGRLCASKVSKSQANAQIAGCIRAHWQAVQWFALNGHFSAGLLKPRRRMQSARTLPRKEARSDPTSERALPRSAPERTHSGEVQKASAFFCTSGPADPNTNAGNLTPSRRTPRMESATRASSPPIPSSGLRDLLSNSTGVACFRGLGIRGHIAHSGTAAKAWHPSRLENTSLDPAQGRCAVPRFFLLSVGWVRCGCLLAVAGIGC